jgi:Glycosyl hydrolase family 71
VVYARFAIKRLCIQHYGADSFNKNFIYRADDWLFAERWDLLINNRQSIDIAQVVTWNDYGESHYVGPIERDQPRSEAWTNGFDHQGTCITRNDDTILTSSQLQAGWVSWNITSKRSRPEYTRE